MKKIILIFFFLFLAGPVTLLAIFLIMYFFIGSPVRITGNSMDPSYRAGQLYMTDKTAYKSSAPQRGDVVIHLNPKDKNQEFIKRIIGVPGDTIELLNGKVFINNKELKEPYLSQGTKTEGGIFLPNGVVIQVPPDSYFVLGDNREKSLDSREWGFITRNEIISKVSFCYFLCN